jgi:hypothetical protein
MNMITLAVFVGLRIPAGYLIILALIIFALGYIFGKSTRA